VPECWLRGPEPLEWFSDVSQSLDAPGAPVEDVAVFSAERGALAVSKRAAYDTTMEARLACCRRAPGGGVLVWGVGGGNDAPPRLPAARATRPNERLSVLAERARACVPGCGAPCGVAAFVNRLRADGTGELAVVYACPEVTGDGAREPRGEGADGAWFPPGAFTADEGDARAVARVAAGLVLPLSVVQGGCA